MAPKTNFPTTSETQTARTGSEQLRARDALPEGSENDTVPTYWIAVIIVVIILCAVFGSLAFYLVRKRKRRLARRRLEEARRVSA